MGKRVVDSGRVGEGAKEAPVDGLDGLLTMLVWELFFLVGVFVGPWDRGNGGEVCSEKGTKELDGTPVCWNTSMW